MGLRLSARDAFKWWPKALHKSTNLNGSGIQNLSLVMLGSDNQIQSASLIFDFLPENIKYVRSHWKM
jgi:hypothetical protein